MKYIDAEKLKAEIERRKDIYIGHALCLKETNLIDGFDEALNIIESLQQEPRFPQYDNIVEKIFGAGNLEWWERNEAEMLVALAKEELLKSLQQEQLEVDKYDCPTTPIEEAIEVTSRMQHIDEEMKPIAKFIMDYASWNLHKSEWNQPTIEVPLFRVLDALVQKGKPYCGA